MDEWKAEVDKLKAKASGATTDAQMELNKQIEALEGKIEEGKDFRGVVLVYVAQGSPQPDEEIAEKGRFWMETS